MQEQQPKLDVLELTLGAVQRLWTLRGPHSLLAYVVVAPYALAGGLGLLDPFYAAPGAEQLPEGYFTAVFVMLVWGAAWNTPAMVLWYRMFLLGPDQMLKLPPGAFVTRAVRLIGYSLLFALMLMAVALVATLIMTFVFSALNGGGAGVNQGLVLAVILVTALILGARLCLTFASIPLGHHFPFKGSWERTKGHGLAIAGAFLLCALVATLAAALAHGIIAGALFGSTPQDGSMVASPWLFAVDFVLAPVSYAGSAMVCAVTTTVFWRLIGRPAEAVDVEV